MSELSANRALSPSLETTAESGGRVLSVLPAASALQRFVRRAREAAVSAQERCELCSEAIPRDHRHLLETASQEIKCVCRACSILFDNEAASNGKHRLIPNKRTNLLDFRMDDAEWEQLRIPVGLAFFFHSTSAGHILAFYPGPMGPTQSLLELDAWTDLVRANPALLQMQPDVEALLVNRARGARRHLIVPIDDCYRLVGHIRLHWKGISGGSEVWNRVTQFFDSLGDQSCLASNPRP